MGLVGTCVLCTCWGLFTLSVIIIRSAGEFNWDLCFVYMLGLVYTFCYCHEAAVSDHPWLSSDTTIQSFSTQTVWAIRQLLGIWMAGRLGCANQHHQ